MPSEKLSVTSIKGSPERCGFDYGQRFEARVMGFCKLELDPTPGRLAYARRCWKEVVRHAPTSEAFMRGLARGARLSLDHIALLSLHEEIFHERRFAEGHCTAFAATRAGASRGQTLLGQTWDWSPALYPWAGLLRLAMKGSPAVALYHYPGLWACAGVNEEGLALVWTGSGYRPPIRPQVGVPTYVLIAEILRLRTVADAVALLSTRRHAGCFIFFLGDRSGVTAVVEGSPGRIAVQAGATVCSRANHYEDAALARACRQHPPDREGTSGYRARRMSELLNAAGCLSLRKAKRILTDRRSPGPWIHQMPFGERAYALEMMTVDSLIADCRSAALWTCRGGRVPGPWQKVTP